MMTSIFTSLFCARIMAMVCCVRPVAIFTLMPGLAFSNGSMTDFFQPCSKEPP